MINIFSYRKFCADLESYAAKVNEETISSSVRFASMILLGALENFKATKITEKNFLEEILDFEDILLSQHIDRHILEWRKELVALKKRYIAPYKSLNETETDQVHAHACAVDKSNRQAANSNQQILAAIS